MYNYQQSASVVTSVLTAMVSNRTGILLLLEDCAGLLFGKPTTFPVLVLKLGRNGLRSGLTREGKVIFRTQKRA